MLHSQVPAFITPVPPSPIDSPEGFEEAENILGRIESGVLG